MALKKPPPVLHEVFCASINAIILALSTGFGDSYEFFVPYEYGVYCFVCLRCRETLCVYFEENIEKDEFSVVYTIS